MPLAGVLLSTKMPLARKATWPEAWALYIVNELEATRKRSGNYFISWNSSIISNWVGIWIRFKSTSIALRVSYYNSTTPLWMSVSTCTSELRLGPAFQSVPLSETKRSDIISVSSLWIYLKELTCLNLDNGLCFYFFCRSKHEQPA